MYESYHEGMNLIMKYIAVTAAYGFSRTVPRIWEKEWRYNNSLTNETERKQMLLTHKAAFCILQTVAAPSVWPIYALEDLSYLEASLKGKSPAEYGID
jgi:hypothetical protein